jgi:gamma-glutamylcyclotransferase (GGCT)/AIG2-like uncharacterized protein YtfP
MHRPGAACKPSGQLQRPASIEELVAGGPKQRRPLVLATRVSLAYGGGQNELGTRMPKLFSYGTLQQENVQFATFGRRLTGVSDALVGYRQSMVAIDDSEVVRTSGKTHHPIVAFTGKSEDRVPGALFEITDAELAHADAYEVAAYVRVKAPLASGAQAWVYVDARGKPPPD